MTAITFASVKRGTRLLIPFGLLILFAAGCASLQEIRAKQSVDRAKAAYAQAKANPSVETYAPGLLAEAGRIVQAAEQTKDYGEMEQLGYMAEKKAQTALTIAEGKRVEKENETLSKEAADLLLQKRVLEANLARREAERSRLAAKEEAATAEKAKKEAEQSRAIAVAEAEKAERSKSEAEAKAREVEQAKLASKAEAERAEKARMEAEAKARQAQQTKAEIDQFLKELSELQGKMTERGIVLTMGDVLFGFGKAELAAGAVRNVDKLAEFLKKHPDRNVLIEGHTDSVGSDQFNLTLSQKRADAVKEVLSAKGVGPDRILTKGYGKQFPVAGNDTESGRQLNRRVEVLILNEGVSPKSMVR
jgi:outer membrane protein OmpA-like peptidoglycan-associated protein